MEMKRQFVMMIFVGIFLSLAKDSPLMAQTNTRTRGSTVAAVQTEPQASAQTVTSSSAVIPALPVPRLVKYSGLVKDANGQPLTGVVGLTFSVYAEQEGGSALWMETQNAQLDKQGRYTVLLGSTQSEGMPLDLFASGEPRWLGLKVELQGEAEQARVLLVSVPYALKASDADTLGGKPLSAFVLAQPQSASGSGATTVTSTQAASSSGTKAAGPNVETPNYLAMFTNGNGAMSNSALFQNASGNIGLGYTNPTNAKLVIAAPSGGGVLNSSNLADQDMFVTLSAPGASDKHAYFGPSTNTNLTLGVGNTEMMRITNTGNVGIGYSNPTNARLVIGAPKGGGVLNASNLVDQDMFINLTAPGASDKHVFFGPSTATNLTLGVSGTEMMRITSSGNVGIGTSTPVEKLTIAGNIQASSAVDALNGNFVGSNGGLLAEDSMNDSTVRYGVQGYATGSYGVGVVGEGHAAVGLSVSSSDASGGVGVFGAGAIGVYGYAGLNAGGSGVNGGTGVVGVAGNGYGVWSLGPFAATGSKSAAVPLPDNRVVLLYSMESPEVWFEDLGSAALKDGVAVIALDPTFAMTVNTTVPYHVYVTPEGDCEGLYVANKTPSSFEVRELRGGKSSTAFEYRIIGKRSGFENLRLEQLQADAETVQQMRKSSRIRPTRVPSVKVASAARGIDVPPFTVPISR